MRQIFHFPGHLKRLALVAVLCLLALLLAGCTTYNGYPTVPPDPTSTPAAAKATPSPSPRPTLAAPPTATPRPSLPAVPNGVTSTKTAILKAAFNDLIENYYQPIASADIYEVGLKAIELGLQQSGIDSQASVQLPQFGTDNAANWDLYMQAYLLVLDKYKGKVTEDQLELFTLSGATSSLGDCVTTYIPPTASDNYYGQRTGQATTVGIGINLQTGQLSNGAYAHLVARTIAGGPAEKAGLKLGDQILAIDGQDLSAMTSTQVIKLLQGSGSQAAGSKVTLSIHHAGASGNQNIEITRNQFQVPAMEHTIINNTTGYIRFNLFPLANQQQLQTITTTMTNWMAEFEKAGVTGYVVDLRGNSNGSISLVQSMLSYFMSGDELVYLNGGRTDQNNQRVYGPFPMPSSQTIKPNDKPMSVLVDGGTAGEAEIFAYAIQQGKRGTVVGDTTAGCLNASGPFHFDDNSALNITIYKAISDVNKPESIVGNVQPDQKATMDLQQLSQGKDSQVDAAVKALTK